MTPHEQYERLMAEQWPTGTYYHTGTTQASLPPLPERPPERPPVRPWTPGEQAQHRADLIAALEGWQDKSEAADRKREYNRAHARQTADLRRHLRLIPGQAQQGHAEAA